MPRIRPKTPSLTAIVEEDYIYIVKCMNKFKQIMTLTITATHKQANEFMTEWSANHKNSYWDLNDSGYPQPFVETKPVKNPTTAVAFNQV